MSVTSQDLLTERYGAPSRSRRRAIWIGAVALGVGFLVWLGWSVWAQITPTVTSELISRSIEDEHTVTAVVDIRMDPGTHATCLLRAFAEDHSIVGELPFDPVTPGRHTETIRTERTATSVELLGCTAPGQDRPR